MNRHVNAIAGPLSLRPPQRSSLEILDRITEIVPPDFHREYRKVVGEEASPLMPEDLTKAIQDTPRDAELIELFKTFSGATPLPT